MDTIIILDFGSQVTQLIARRVRECGVYCEIHPFNISEEKLQSFHPKGIILSGGPASVYSEGAPIPSFHVVEFAHKHDIPILGICYGLQLMAFQNGGEVNKSAKREFGRAELCINMQNAIFEGIGEHSLVWMSHGDSLTKIPDGFEIGDFNWTFLNPALLE